MEPQVRSMAAGLQGWSQAPLGAPQSIGAAAPLELQLQSQYRSMQACRGQPAPSRQAQGGQSLTVSLNALLCARQRGGRAWLSLRLGMLAG